MNVNLFVVAGALLLGLLAYFVPTVVAFSRGVPNKGSVLVVNLFLGWTLVGWVVAMAMAVRSAQQQGARY
ncbi:superinfection immunity protein [Streptomyces sp. NBC_01013]|uniref:superinfection immunity protein n=1 Tax=Streptomyces sp. NBC_01013 TaxID=2903718 RepID=UPI00386F4227|nr:superinfection immunity protein [Streptomyces sp. NBC_01013]